MSSCYYFAYNGFSFTSVEAVAFVYTLFLFLITVLTGERIYAFFGLYLYAPQWMCWCVQYYFRYYRPNPCAIYMSYAFPELNSMYVGAALGAFIGYFYLWKHVVYTWISWLLLYILAIVPAMIFIYLGWGAWWQVTISLAIGFLSGILFAYIVRYFVRPNMKYLQWHIPFSLFGYKDTLINRRNKEEIQKSLERVWHASRSI
jgi:hypothetical protein